MIGIVIAGLIVLFLLGLKLSKEETKKSSESSPQVHTVPDIHVTPAEPLPSDDKYPPITAADLMILSAFDEEDQIDEIRRQAINGDGTAATYMGMCYLDRINNRTVAFDWFRIAYDLKDPDGIFLLGKCYSAGYGVEADKSLGGKIIVEAAQKGSTDAIVFLRDECDLTDNDLRNLGINV